MTSFKDQPFAQRMAQMGDAAERKFEETYGEGFVRFGLNRPPINVGKLPTRLRYTPDYLTSDGFVEVQGFGKAQVFQLKLEKLSCLNYWDTLHPVSIFVWDSYRKRYTTVPLKSIRDWIDEGLAELGYFPEGKAYFAIPADVIFAKSDLAAA